MTRQSRQQRACMPVGKEIERRSRRTVATATLLAPVALIAFILLIDAVSAGEKEEQQVEHLTLEEFLKLEGPEEFERVTREAEDAAIAAWGVGLRQLSETALPFIFQGTSLIRRSTRWKLQSP